MQPANKGVNAANSKHSLTRLDLSSVGTNSNKVVVADFNTDQCVYIGSRQALAMLKPSGT